MIKDKFNSQVLSQLGDDLQKSNNLISYLVTANILHFLSAIS